MFKAAISLTITAHLKGFVESSLVESCLVCKMYCSKVVFPAPKNPLSNVIGSNVLELQLFPLTIARGVVPRAAGVLDDRYGVEALAIIGGVAVAHENGVVAAHLRSSTKGVS